MIERMTEGLRHSLASRYHSYSRSIVAAGMRRASRMSSWRCGAIRTTGIADMTAARLLAELRRMRDAASK